GYFSYKRDGFGEILEDKYTLLNKLKELIIYISTNSKNNIVENKIIFTNKKNCQRIYHKIFEIL
ncbi:hypothetical protein FQW58_08805, partial [Campylobacter jejuni]|nr:hypothetical protein [Campylobacter jejuni]